LVHGAKGGWNSVKEREEIYKKRKEREIFTVKLRYCVLWRMRCLFHEVWDANEYTV
jgi:hypothetical protein